MNEGLDVSEGNDPEAVSDIPVQISVVLGQTSIAVQQLSNLARVPWSNWIVRSVNRSTSFNQSLGRPRRGGGGRGQDRRI